MLERLIVDRMENRILVGITMFVAIMVLVGWVAINENARMVSFERQYLARSVERGAEKFAANCATCHGNDARGIANRAPALNSPHLFGYDFFAAIDAEIKAIDAEEATLNAELTTLAEELGAANLTTERQNEIVARRQEISDLMNGENGIAVRRAAALEAKTALIAQLQPAIDRGYPISSDFDENGNPILVVQSSRLAQLSWANTLDSFIHTTLIHGRPTSVGYWPAPMVAWAQAGGGPLRDDQVEDITNYILNFDKGSNWTIEDLLAVQQFGIVPGLPGAGGEMQPPAGADALAILTRIEEQALVGDPARGDSLYHGQQLTQRNKRLGCSGCHAGGAAAPATEGTWDRVVNERMPALSDYTPEHYVIESIVNPGVYVVEGFAAGAMPGDFGTDQMSTQDIADVLAYIKTTGAEGAAALGDTAAEPVTETSAETPAEAETEATAEPEAEATAEATTEASGG